MDWHGKTAIVTGGGSGIGKNLSIELATKGCKVTVIVVIALHTSQSTLHLWLHRNVVQAQKE
jgi:NAD(P)-dependent dehydrogenase (short-subunit alcohol dehydrogenase family)